MQIAAGRITLDFYANEDLALKHRKLEELCSDLRRKFNLSALEVDRWDEPEQCVIGFAAVIPTYWKTARGQQFLDRITKEIDQTSFARVVLEDCDLIPMD